MNDLEPLALVMVKKTPFSPTPTNNRFDMNEIFNKKFLRQLFTPYGRLQRRPFAYCLLFYILTHIALRWLSVLAMPLMPVMVMMLTLLLTVVITLAMLCLTIRRYHDFGCTGWIPGGSLLLTFAFGMAQSLPTSPLSQADMAPTVAIVNVVLSAIGLLVMALVPLAMPSTKKPTRYDAQPYNDTEVVVKRKTIR